MEPGRVGMEPGSPELGRVQPPFPRILNPLAQTKTYKIHSRRSLRFLQDLKPRDFVGTLAVGWSNGCQEPPDINR